MTERNPLSYYPRSVGSNETAPVNHPPPPPHLSLQAYHASQKYSNQAFEIRTSKNPLASKKKKKKKKTKNKKSNFQKSNHSERILVAGRGSEHVTLERRPATVDNLTEGKTGWCSTVCYPFWFSSF